MSGNKNLFDDFEKSFNENSNSTSESSNPFGSDFDSNSFTSNDSKSNSSVDGFSSDSFGSDFGSTTSSNDFGSNDFSGTSNTFSSNNVSESSEFGSFSSSSNDFGNSATNSGSSSNTTDSQFDSFSGSSSSFGGFSSFQSNTDEEEETDSLRPKRKEGQTAKMTLTRAEYLKRLSELNKDADHKHFVILFGAPDTGKTFLIANIINYMMSQLPANVRLSTTASIEAQKQFNLFLESFNNPYNERNSIGRTATSELFELPIEIEPKDRKKPSMEVTFIDASGENFALAYKSIDDKYADKYRGEIPDSIRVILDSYVNKYFLFLWDHTKDSGGNTSAKAPQVGVLQAFFDQICTRQNMTGQTYHKLLVIAKSDLIPDKVKSEYGYDSRLFAEDPVIERRAISTFTKNFFSESEETNACIFYSAGKQEGDFFQEEHESAAKVFNWLYQSATGTTLKPTLSFWQKLKRWGSGE
ncbi:hypothetical protein [Psittacicella gerlachiana]|uniref:Uncharacterized protein n=1 Tax=Psittacicella gerlachiana TaxID=2028574 RepID=A0A3A1Y342_9GAMM|nr:hypothetical protein [Psittacicella gerlachiana]RIY31656.1 hypothetical protein CKF59_07475 [Psittacicella gerlachiana]